MKPFFKQLEPNLVYNPSIPSYHRWSQSSQQSSQSKCHPIHHTCEGWGVLSAVPLRIPPMAGSFRSGECITPRRSLSRKQHRQDIRNLLRRAVLDELLEGTKLIGETDRECESICAKVKDAPSETDDAVWSKTLEEVERGWLLGPFDPHQFPSHYPLSRRFGVVQGEKTRCVDDFSRSHVDSCVQVTEAPKPHTIDVLASLLMQAMTTAKESDGWCVRTLDLKDAYRQGAAATNSFAFSHIVVREPSTGMPKVFKMLALAFGSVKSVHAFLRIARAHSLWFWQLVHWTCCGPTTSMTMCVVAPRARPITFP